MEDNEINQQIAVELLEGAGAKVQVAGNGSEAVETLSNGPQPPPFDVVLMDLQMPEMDGYQATAKLRSDPRFSQLPIIAMTAHATIEERQRCLGVGMNDHISKPIDPAMLFATVGRFCRPLTGISPGRVATTFRTEASRPRPPKARRRGASDELPAIDGLDTQDGLSRVAGNRKLYLKLLRQFVEQQGPAVGQITAALAQGDAALAERLAHTLKGVAGNIGAKAVQAAAGALEKLIRARAAAAEVDPAKQQVAAALDPLVAQLKSALGSPGLGQSPANRAARQPLSPAQSRDGGERNCSSCFRNSIPARWISWRRTSAALRPLFAAEAWPRFEKLVQGYAFADAQTQLEQAMKSHLMKELSESRVLIVDDVPANVDVLVQALRGDYQLSVAIDGAAALRTAEKLLPDLVLLDIVMPGIDGYEVCRRLRASPRTREIPVMFLSSLEDVQNKAKGFEAGGNDYLVKPFEMLEVKARVRSLLRAKAYADAVKEKIASELRIAREIQMGILSPDVAAVTDGTGLEAHAILHPAQEVGGDLYEVLRMPDGNIVAVMGDVSGKGIPGRLVHGSDHDPGARHGCDSTSSGGNPAPGQRCAGLAQSALHVCDAAVCDLRRANRPA